VNVNYISQSLTACPFQSQLFNQKIEWSESASQKIKFRTIMEVKVWTTVIDIEVLIRRAPTAQFFSGEHRELHFSTKSIKKSFFCWKKFRCTRPASTLFRMYAAHIKSTSWLSIYCRYEAERRGGILQIGLGVKFKPGLNF
jgi:hypothetical protein